MQKKAFNTHILEREIYFESSDRKTWINLSILTTIFLFLGSYMLPFPTNSMSSTEKEKYEVKAAAAHLACCCSVSADGENGATWIQQCCCCCWSLWSCCQDWESPLLCWIPAAAHRLQCRERNFALPVSRRDTAPLERSSCTAATSVPLLPSRPVRSTVNHDFTAQCLIFPITFANQHTLWTNNSSVFIPLNCYVLYCVGHLNVLLWVNKMVNGYSKFLFVLLESLSFRDASNDYFHYQLIYRLFND